MDRIGGAGLRFRKMHGLGNDFVVLDARTGGVEVTPGLARALGDRHRGVGFDQLAVIGTAEDADASIVFWNTDGSIAGACGNATRCVAELLMREGGDAPVTMRTAGGILGAERLPDGRIRVDMGLARTRWQDIPLAEAADTVALPLPGAPGAVAMPNPHCVFFVGNAEAVDLVAEGPRWEHHPMFPERANVEFCQVLAPDRVRMRVWERGTGVTLACGSGACAVAVAGARKGLTGREITIVADGGELELHWREDGHVTMAGPVSDVFEGELTAEFLGGLVA